MHLQASRNFSGAESKNIFSAKMRKIYFFGRFRCIYRPVAFFASFFYFFDFWKNRLFALFFIILGAFKGQSEFFGNFRDVPKMDFAMRFYHFGGI